MKTTPRIFISYSHTDKEVVDAITARLNALAIPCFLDEKDIDLGQDIPERVHGGISSCSDLIVVISPGSRKSAWVPFEIGIATGLGLGIIPFLAHPAEEPLPFMKNIRYTANIDDLIAHFEKASRKAGPDWRNPKPFGVRDATLDEVYLMIGGGADELELGVRYNHRPLQYPDEISEIKPHLKSQAEEKARASGAQYFNGPNTRLVRFTEELTRQDPNGQERRGVMLELGPVSWEEYTILNTFLDHSLRDGRTIREAFVDVECLYKNDRDLRWCRLSNILSLGIVPVTSDGFGLVQIRNPKGVSTEGGQLTSGVAENIHRYLDEAPRNDLRTRLHPLRLPAEVASEGKVDQDYRPRGVPSPFLAAQRGLWEEISADLGRDLSFDAYHFLAVGFELTKFQPVLVGTVEIGLTRAEVDKTRLASPGKDHSEFLEILYLPLDAAAPETMRALAQKERWVAGGLAAFLTAIQFWAARH